MLKHIRAFVCASTLGLFLFSNQAFGQQARLHIEDDGKVRKEHQEHHAKVGHKITWARRSGSSKPWYVKFDESPCAEGSEFGSDRGKTCTINVTCKAAGDEGCKAYSYKSATGSDQALNDPTVVVDP
jgi:hypothetical protein